MSTIIESYDMQSTEIGAHSGGASPANSTCSSIGRMKAPPVCEDSFLKASAQSTAELSQWVFPTDFQLTSIDTSSMNTSSDHHYQHHNHPIPVSSSSSTCTRESDNGVFSDVEIKNESIPTPSRSKEAAAAATPTGSQRTATERMNAIVSLRKTSRQGRATQRWVTDPETNDVIRLTTGCVPILRDGRILFVSASRKPEWILPKGGWEKDEALEESAVRECFEEAGVLGVLGPKLTEIQYETRKAKKRRLEQEEQQKKRAKETDEESFQDDAKVPAAENDLLTSETAVHSPAIPTPSTAVLSEDTMKIIRKQLDEESKAVEITESSSVASAVSAANYSQVRMKLIPLYVTHVADVWPESGRFRKAVDIEEAIRMVDSRPEFKNALLEVKEKGLHLVSRNRL